MILVASLDDFDRKKLALLKYFLVKVCEQIISEIGELLPSKFLFILWESPLSLSERVCYRN